VLLRKTGKDIIMDKRRAFTLIEILVVVAVISILLTIMVSSLSQAREAGRRTVCLSNLRVLQLAWIGYSQDNDEKIVDGQAISYDPVIVKNFQFDNDSGWVCSDAERIIHNPDPYEDKLEFLKALQYGKLFKYIGNVKVYRCPNGIKNELRTYSIVDSMNGIRDPNVTNHNRVGDTVLWIQNRLDIKNPASRMVFLDAGIRVPFSFRAYYHLELWKYGAPARHGNGNTFSFADGHAEYWKWQGKDTITNGFALNQDPKAYNKYDNITNKRLYNPSSGLPEYVIDIKPTTNGGFADLHKFQKAVWGRLGYTPTPTD
jgi:prepilin-type N-terminal cleavage/methylation domain-containing protein/prepilin-type processing-associated H-X9-DG protein